MKVACVKLNCCGNWLWFKAFELRVWCYVPSELGPVRPLRYRLVSIGIVLFNSTGAWLLSPFAAFFY